MADAVTFRINTSRFGQRLQRFIRENTSRLDQIVFKVASDVLADTVEGWPVDQGISRAAWRGPVRGTTAGVWRITNPMPYAIVIEFGGYPGVGPKTVELGAQTFPGGIRVAGGIFPSQRPHAPLRRAISANRLEITRLAQIAMRQQWGRG